MSNIPHWECYTNYRIVKFHTDIGIMLTYTKIRIILTYTLMRIGGIVENEMTIENVNTTALLGVSLKRIRKQKGLSQEAVAKQMGMRQATVSDIESGKGTLDSLMKLIQVLQLNLVISNTSVSLKKNSKTQKMLSMLEDE